MIEHFVVPVFSEIWWQGLIFSAGLISIPVMLGRRLDIATQKQLGLILGTFLLLLSLSIHPYMISKGMWTPKSSLPLQLCSISALLSGLLFFSRHQLMYELVVYWGLAGAIHSLLTPEMSLGRDGYLIFEYYAAHAGIILSALYFSAVYGYKPRKRSWWRVFIITQIVILLVGAINLLLDSNYMYLCKKPLAENPFVIGDWPWYVLILELVGLAHFFAVYLIFRAARHVHPAGYKITE